MISKRTAIILVVVIAIIIGLETKYGLDRFDNLQQNVDRTVAQVTLLVDGKTVDLEGESLVLESGDEQPISAPLSTLGKTGFEGLPYNSGAFKVCEKGINKLTLTIPKESIPDCKQDLTINFGYKDNKWDFNNYSLVIKIATDGEDGPTADIAQTLYYPDEKGNAHEKSNLAHCVLSNTNGNIDCIIE